MTTHLCMAAASISISVPAPYRWERFRREGTLTGQEIFVSGGPLFRGVLNDLWDIIAECLKVDVKVDLRQET